MKRAFLKLCAIGLMALAVAVPAMAQTAEDRALALAAQPPQDLDTYYNLKAEIGDDQTRTVLTALTALAHKEANLHVGDVISGCRLPQWNAPVSAGLLLALSASDQTTWILYRDQASKRLNAWDRIWSLLQKQEKTEADFDSVAGQIAASQHEQTEKGRTLSQRVARDQFNRLSMQITSKKRLWAEGAAEPVQLYLSAIVYEHTCTADIDNTAWLKAQLAESGWFRISVYGPNADKNAWLLVQHADHDVAFQKQVLSLLEPLIPLKETLPSNYAYLYDRVAIAEKRAQRYGTQGRCIGDKKWKAFEVENPDQLDARRASVGLMPQAEYEAIFTFCTLAMVPPSET
ncbi:DUF6624 domain-containing protein [Asticcacaulis excentricus]|uniref:Uncharacterized protein n=1 Tax=Asticcacaulis excentricus (strain ATCC 15261 / DSM 4724 / KCTC 12464 / NCIMB 9791 / VKM B-1370 / CB 48) TaxID=573065 RepID=E8RKZ8_ASTEC|nr:DUF6624 domain-containing protein [Asticcacaulis excentricus]ADU13611.1 hypothetical protein Astex_1948 [Asticcacaulis excentricus CB 48]